MLYTSVNIQVSMTYNLAAYLRENGFTILWQATGDEEPPLPPFTTPLGTVSLVPVFPDNPAFVVTAKTQGTAGLNGDSTSAEEIVLPAFSVSIGPAPKRQDILGLGHKNYEWEREISVSGLVVDEYQQRQFTDLLHVWLQSEEHKEFAVSRFDVDPVSPTALDPVWVEFAHVTAVERYDLPANVRYQIHAKALLNYVE